MKMSKRKKPRATLLPDFGKTDAEKEWVGMPEFIQEDLTAYRTIIINFDNEEDVKKFAKIIKQRITPLTKSIWYPKAQIQIVRNKIYRQKI